jgi:hypothetical protein
MPSWPRPPNYGWAMRTRLRLLSMVADVNAHRLLLLHDRPDCDLAVWHQAVRIARLALFAAQPSLRPLWKTRQTATMSGENPVSAALPHSWVYFVVPLPYAPGILVPLLPGHAASLAWKGRYGPTVPKLR